MKKTSIFLSLLIGQIYIWTGSVFMTVLYHLYDFYDGTRVTLITEGLYYMMQVLGILAFSLFFKYRRKLAEKSVLVMASVLLTALFAVLCLISHDGIRMIWLGSLMNLGIGFLSGQLFTRIAVYVPGKECGLVYGISYAIGSIGTYLLSLPENGQGLTADHIIWVYLLMMALSLFLCRYLTDQGESAELMQKSAADPKQIALAFGTLFLCYIVYTLGYHFATMDMTAGVNPSFTRAFYALSLIAAGVINDRSRRVGALLGFLVLVFPFISLALHGMSGTATLLCVLSYLFLGFLSVYRVILFTDLADSSPDRIYLAPYGLMTGFFGTAVGTTAGLLIDEDQVVLTLVTAALFLVCGVLFFVLFAKMYPTVKSDPEHFTDRSFYDFQVKYSLNANQMEIFRLILEGHSNGKIADELHLAESTIKYHVKNILKATNCSNRADLIALFHDFC